jgi:hypothetical protein
MIADCLKQMVTSVIETQEMTTNGSVNMQSIVNEIRHNVLQNAHLRFKLRYLGENIWTLRVKSLNGPRSAKIEIIVDEYSDPEDRGARGAVFTYGDVPHEHIDLVMHSIIERI